MRVRAATMGMPFVRIDLITGKRAAVRKQIVEIIYNVMRHIINVPADGKFQVVTQCPLGFKTVLTATKTPLPLCPLTNIGGTTMGIG